MIMMVEIFFKKGGERKKSRGAGGVFFLGGGQFGVPKVRGGDQKGAIPAGRSSFLLPP